MANPKPPRLVEWRGYWYLFSYNWEECTPERIPCSKYEAFTKSDREKLLRRMKDKYILEQATSMQNIGGVDFKRPLCDALNDYLGHVQEQKELRESNPIVGYGIGKVSAYTCRLIVTAFQDWLRANNRESMPCEALDTQILEKFFGSLVSTTYKAGKKKKKHRAASTINNYRNRIGGSLRWLNMQRPKLFPDFDLLLPALKLKSTSPKPAFAITPDDLNHFLDDSRKPLPAAKVKRVRGGRTQTFIQSQSAFASTPVDRLFLLLACTGMRLGEALSLKWSDLDLESGRIVIKSQKTSAWRMIPLIGAPECAVSPGFFRTIKKWRKELSNAVYVLPHAGIEKPAFPKRAWERVRKNSGVDITPQTLRQNFVSYCASMGVPPAVAAMWCGHSAQVAERLTAFVGTSTEPWPKDKDSFRAMFPTDERIAVGVSRNSGCVVINDRYGFVFFWQPVILGGNGTTEHLEQKMRLREAVFGQSGKYVALITQESRIVHIGLTRELLEQD